jgi:glutaredoxin 3
MSIVVYSKENCSFCVQAKNLLNRRGMAFQEIPMNDKNMVESVKLQYPNAKTAPVIIMDGVYVGGYQQLQSILESNPQLLTE